MKLSIDELIDYYEASDDPDNQVAAWLQWIKNDAIPVLEECKAHSSGIPWSARGADCMAALCSVVLAHMPSQPQEPTL